MFNATLENQFAIQTPKGVGAASRLTDVISHQAKANIRALWANEQGNQGQFYLITDDNGQVADYLGKNGFENYSQEQVLVVSAPDQTGSVAQVAQTVADAGININYLYTTVFDGRPAVILHTSDNQKARGLFS